MTREEYYASSEFKLARLLNNETHQVGHQVQKLGDILELFCEKFPGINVGDKYCIVEQQLRILNSEARRLVDQMSRFVDVVRPTEFDPNPDDAPKR